MNKSSTKTKRHFSVELKKIMRPGIAAAIVVAVIIVLSFLYLRFEWDRNQEAAASEAIVLAQSLEVMLHPEHIVNLSGSLEDLQNPDYITIKNSLTKLAETTNQIRFAYLLGEKDGNVVFMVDSEKPDSVDYSPPGQVFSEAQETDRRAFFLDETILTEPMTDRWGTWISALVPVKDHKGGKTIAVLGIDYSASDWTKKIWNQMLPNIIIVIIVFLLSLSVLYIWLQHSRIRNIAKELDFERTLYHSVFEQAPIGIAIVKDKGFVLQTEYKKDTINSAFMQILQRSSAELSNIDWIEITHPDEIKADLEKFEQFKNGEIDSYAMEKRFVRPDGTSVWTHMMVSPLVKFSDKYFMHICLLEDISRRKEAEERITEIANQNEFLAYHDYLTGVYNRRFFEEEFERRKKRGDFPIALLLGDVNGFKLFNDTFGHIEGDKVLIETTKKIKTLIEENDVLCRIGGDEFAIIISGKTESEVQASLHKLEKDSGDVVLDVPEEKLVTVSWGYSIQRTKEDTIDMLQEEAEAFMYNRKFFSYQSSRGKAVDVIMEALFAKSEQEKKHSERVGILCEAIAQEMGMDKMGTDKIRVAGLLHDIGKIGIDETILNKTGNLDVKDWEIIKLHPAKGAGILEKISEFHDTADIVLSHHENYDGSGYPRKLKGEQIPVGARIVAVADKYDAMTNTRPYRAAISAEAALEEMAKCSGTQMDPEIVSVLINKVIGRIITPKENLQ